MGPSFPEKRKLRDRTMVGVDLNKIVLAFKLVLLIQASFNTEKLFTDIFGISPTSWTKNQYTFLFVPQIDLILRIWGKAI